MYNYKKVRSFAIYLKCDLDPVYTVQDPEGHDIKMNTFQTNAVHQNHAISCLFPVRRLFYESDRVIRLSQLKTT